MSQVSALLQIADGGLQRVGEILQRMKGLATQFNSGTLTAAEEGFIDAEMATLNTEIALIGTSTTFNGTALIGGAYNETIIIGAAAADTLVVDLSTVNVTTVGDAAVGATTPADIEADIDTIGTARATVGSLQSAVGFQGDVIATQIENLQAAKSAIADVDIAAEQTRFTNFQVLTEAAIAGLSQANQITQSLLSLLR